MKNVFEGSTIYQEPKKAGIKIEVEEVMRETAEDMEKIINQLQKSIARYDYQVVLGIDGGGRVPGLLMGKFLKEVYEHDGVPSPKTTFIAGSRSYSDDQDERQRRLEEYFSLPLFEEVKKNNKKVLLVDDVIATGTSVQGITEALQQRGVAYKVVALTRIDTYTQPVQKNIVFASESGSSLYGNSTMSGVHKERGAIFSQTIRRPLPDDSIKSNIPNASDYESNTNDSTEQGVSEDKQVYAGDEVVLHRTRELVEAYAHELAVKFIASREQEAEDTE